MLNQQYLAINSVWVLAFARMTVLSVVVLKLHRHRTIHLS